MDEVVKPNVNVIAVGSGHYHDAYTRTDEMDDDGDGVADRTVYSMLFDYQGLPEGGLGYLRLLHFDNQGNRIVVRTYSPSLDDFDSDDPSLDPVHQDFEIPYAASGLQPRTKVLSTDELGIDILTTEEIESFEGVASGTPLSATWDVTPGRHGWYVRTANPYGAADHSVVHTFTVAGTPSGTLDADSDPDAHADRRPRAVGAGSPALSGRAQVGKTLVVDPGGVVGRSHHDLRLVRRRGAARGRAGHGPRAARAPPWSADQRRGDRGRAGSHPDDGGSRGRHGRTARTSTTPAARPRRRRRRTHAGASPPAIGPPGRACGWCGSWTVSAPARGSGSCCGRCTGATG